MRGSLPASGGVAVDGSEGSLVAHRRGTSARRAGVARGFPRARAHVWPFSPAPRKSERKPPASDDPGGRGTRAKTAARRSRSGESRARDASDADGTGAPSRSANVMRVRSVAFSVARVRRSESRSNVEWRYPHVEKRREAPSRAAGCRVVATPPRRPRMCDAPREARLGSTGAFFRRDGPRGGRRAVVPDPNATRWFGATRRRSGSTLASLFPETEGGRARISAPRGRTRVPRPSLTRA